MIIVNATYFQSSSWLLQVILTPRLVHLFLNQLGWSSSTLYFMCQSVLNFTTLARSRKWKILETMSCQHLNTIWTQNTGFLLPEMQLHRKQTTFEAEAGILLATLYQPPSFSTMERNLGSPSALAKTDIHVEEATYSYVELNFLSNRFQSRPYEHNSKECQCVGLAKSFARYVDLQFPPCSWTHILPVAAQQPSFCRETPLCFSFEASLLPAPLNHNSPSWQPGSPDTANLVLSTRARQGQWSEWAAEWKGDCEERNDVPSRLQSRFLSLFGLLPPVLIWPAGTLSSTTLLASSNFYSCHRNTTGVACHHWEKTKLAIY